jgi:hypothetical protein
MKPWSVSSTVPGASLTTLLFAVVIVACVYIGREVLVPMTLAILMSFVLAPPAAGSPDRPSLHLRERNSSMKNRTRESCTSGSVSGGAVALAAGLPSERLEVIEHSGNQFLSPMGLARSAKRLKRSAPLGQRPKMRNP